MKGIGYTSLVKVYERVREICYFCMQKGPKRQTDAFYGREKVNKMSWFCDLIPI